MEGETPPVVPAEIYDETEGTPTTGDSFAFEANATDDVSVADVRLVLMFECTDGNTAETNTSMGAQGGAAYRTDVIVPSNALEARYSFAAVDSAGNWNRTGMFALGVADNDVPVASGGTTGTPTTGGNFILNGTVADNIAVSSARAIFSFQTAGGNTTLSNASMASDGTGRHSLEISVPDDALSLRYSIGAVDGAGNWNATAAEEMEVADDDSPSVTPVASGYAATGLPFTMTVEAEDNVAVAGATAHYFFETVAGNSSEASGDMTAGTGHSYALDIDVPVDAVTVHWRASAEDGDGNAGASSERAVQVLDVVAPEIDAGNGSIAAVGELVDLAASRCSDNICLHNETWTFSHNGTEVSLYGEAASYRFWAPGNYTVKLNVTDKAGNWAVDAMIIEVHAQGTTPVPPDGEPFPWWLLLLVACLAAGIIIAYAASRRRKDGGRAADGHPHEGHGSPTYETAPAGARAGPTELTSPPEPSAPASTPGAAPQIAASTGDNVQASGGAEVAVPHGELLENLEKRYREGKISEETYRMLREKYGGAS